MLVVIQGEEYQKIKKQSIINGTNKKFRRNSTWTKGLNNTDKDPYKVERWGKLGEYAFAKHFNVEEFSLEETGRKYDLKFMGKTVDVKTISYPKLLINTDVGFHAERCVVFKVLEDDGESKAVLKLLGWCTKKDILNAKIEKSPKKGAYHNNYVVEYYELKKFSAIH